MARYAISILLERLDSEHRERIMLHHVKFNADHDFHALDVAKDLDVITPLCSQTFAKSLYEWFQNNKKAADPPDE